MCFSATASFALAGVLVPAGVFALAKARRTEPSWLGFAAFPLAFGNKQAIEGVVWLGINGDDPGLEAVASRGFLVFSHFFWLVFVPFAALTLEQDPRRKRVLRAMTVLGALFGLSIAAPSILVSDRLAVEVVERSLDYQTRLIYEGVVPRTALKVFYAIIVMSALLMPSDRRVRVFSGLIAASLAVTYLFFAYAFISVWCFFAAGLSVYLIAVTGRVPQSYSRAEA